MTIKIITIKKYECDSCKKEITSTNIYAKIGEVDLCEICLKEAYLEYMRLIEKQVPSRRGGFRALGEYDS